MTAELTMQTLAEEARNAFEQAKRDNGDDYWRRKEGFEEGWLHDLCMAAHGDMLPDDWRYSFIVEALDAIGEADDVEDVTLEADIYTHDLTAWLGSRADRYGYCDEAINDQHWDTASGMVELLQVGQALEKAEVLASVLSSLRNELEARSNA